MQEGVPTKKADPELCLDFAETTLQLVSVCAEKQVENSISLDSDVESKTSELCWHVNLANNW